MLCSDKRFRSNPEILEQAVDRIQSRIIRERLASYESIQGGLPRWEHGDSGNQCHPRGRVLCGFARTAL